MTIFEFDSYKAYVRAWVNQQPKSRGTYRRMADHLNVSSTMVSQVFNSDKDLSLEMAADLSSFLSLNEKEERHLFALVEYSRAGTTRLKRSLKRQIEEAAADAQKIAARVQKDRELKAEEKALYYSSWVYTGLRNLVALPRAWTTPALAEKLQISESQIRAAIQFLIDKKLLELVDGRYNVLTKATHLGLEDPLVNKHHQNWRLRGFQKMENADPSNLFYTAPMSLSREDAQRIRDRILEMIQEVNKIVVNSPSEAVRCLAVDFYEY